MYPTFYQSSHARGCSIQVIRVLFTAWIPEVGRLFTCRFRPRELKWKARKRRRPDCWRRQTSAAVCEAPCERLQLRHLQLQSRGSHEIILLTQHRKASSTSYNRTIETELKRTMKSILLSALRLLQLCAQFCGRLICSASTASCATSAASLLSGLRASRTAAMGYRDLKLH